MTSACTARHRPRLSWSLRNSWRMTKLVSPRLWLLSVFVLCFIAQRSRNADHLVMIRTRVTRCSTHGPSSGDLIALANGDRHFCPRRSRMRGSKRAKPRQVSAVVQRPVRKPPSRIDTEEGVCSPTSKPRVLDHPRHRAARSCDRVAPRYRGAIFLLTLEWCDASRSRDAPAGVEWRDARRLERLEA
jgi:hypothetical protein